MLEINYTLTFGAILIGLASSVHCVGMCGGIIGALSYSLPADIRENNLKRFTYVTSYNLGRLTSYSAMGLLAGLLGAEVFNLLGAGSGHFVMRLIAATLIALTGLYLAGWFPQFARTEKLGEVLWSKLAPIGKHLIPVKSIPQGFLYGCIWGWLPCSLVYTMLIISSASGGASQGMVSMLAFGLGTLPSMILTGVFASQVRRFTRIPEVRMWIGISLVVMAVASLFIPHEWLMPESVPGYEFSDHEHMH
jgi:sulfite exporter TauE/SafE